MDVIRRVGVMGGTFDPIHLGHLVAAQEAASVLQLDRVLFIPVWQPPHKTDEPSASPEDRLCMVRLAVADNPIFEVSTIEVDHPGRSFTVDTLRRLVERYPDSELNFILGMDSLAELPKWHDPAGILGLARIVALYRAGWKTVDLAVLARALPESEGRVSLVPMPELDIAATELRERVREHRPIRYLVPDAVASYIEEHKLYGG
jgi:nicotinate-nucleotide adenylyltransferase